MSTRRTALAGGLAGLGQALMRRSDIARENEIMTRQETRQDALLTRQETRDDLLLKRQEAIARAREIREGLVREKERSEERDFQRTENEKTRTFQGELAGDERDLMIRRFDREDRRAVEEEATNQLAALDKRIQDLQDMKLKGEVLGSEGEVDRQLQEANQQQLTVRGRLVERLFEMGDPRYKDMPADQRAYAAGYSKDQVAAFMRLAQGDEADTEEPAAPEIARSDAEIGSSVAATEARNPGWSPGLTPEDRAQLGMPPKPSPSMAPPESPPPLQDMTKVGRGRSLLNPSGARTPRAARERREAAAAEAAKPTPKDAAQDTIKGLLEPYGGDLEKAPENIRKVVGILRSQLLGE
jgi:hypothetical protein